MKIPTEGPYRYVGTLEWSTRFCCFKDKDLGNYIPSSIIDRYIIYIKEGIC